MPKHCFYKLNRGDDKNFGEAFYRCSYLAKVRGKGYGSLGANKYSVSQVRLKSRVSHTYTSLDELILRMVFKYRLFLILFYCKGDLKRVSPNFFNVCGAGSMGQIYTG